MLDVDRKTIDQTLQTAERQAIMFSQQLVSGALLPQSLEELRSSDLGLELDRLALFGRGELEAPSDEILEAVDQISRLLYSPAMAEEEPLPMSFWNETEIGKLFSRAKLRALTQEQLVPLPQAVDQLGVTAADVYRWMDGGFLDGVRDPESGQSFITRQSIDWALSRPGPFEDWENVEVIDQAFY